MTEKSTPVSSVAVKRNASTAALNDQPYRPAKRRAPKACQCCRTRKVRCNVTESGPPCMNCRLDEVECVVTESKRKRRALPKVEEEEQPGEPPKSKPTRPGRPVASNVLADGVLNFASLPQIHRVRKLDQTEHVPHPLYRSLDESISATGINPRTPSVASLNMQQAIRIRNDHPRSSMDSLKSFSSGPSLTWQPSTPPVPAFLTPVPSRFGPDEIIYLHKKRAFSIPEPSLRDAIFRAYAEFVHPLMPILDLRNWLKIVHQGDCKSEKLSLLLFQAVMFCGSNFVNIEYLVKAGFGSRSDARDSFFQKTKLLYDFDYEEDQITQIQALLLMTWSSNIGSENKDNRHWMSLAIGTARIIGIHRNSFYTHLDTHRRRQIRRLWWSLVIRNRLLAVECHQSARVRLEDSDVAILKMEDFELAISSPELTRMEINYPSTGDITTQRSLATICIEHAKLCLCVKGDIGWPDDDSVDHILESNNLQVQEADLDKLDTWYRNLPLIAQLDNTASQSPSHCNSSVIVHRSFLYMAYSAIRRALSMTGNVKGDNTIEAGTMGHILNNLLDRQLIRHLPTTSVSILTSIITHHLREYQSTVSKVPENHIQEFMSCVKALKELQEVYPSAQKSFAEIEFTIRRSAIPSISKGPKGHTVATKGRGNGKLTSIGATSDLITKVLQTGLITPGPFLQTLTPPPDNVSSTSTASTNIPINTPTNSNPSLFTHPFTLHPARPQQQQQHHQQEPQHTQQPTFDHFDTVLTPPSSHGSLDASGQEEPWPLLDLVGQFDSDFDEFINIEEFPVDVEVGMDVDVDVEMEVVDAGMSARESVGGSQRGDVAQADMEGMRDAECDVLEVAGGVVGIVEVGA